MRFITALRRLLRGETFCHQLIDGDLVFVRRGASDRGRTCALVSAKPALRPATPTPKVRRPRRRPRLQAVRQAVARA